MKPLYPYVKIDTVLKHIAKLESIGIDVPRNKLNYFPRREGNCLDVWRAADAVYADGEKVTAAAVAERLPATANRGNINTEVSLWRKFHQRIAELQYVEQEAKPLNELFDEEEARKLSSK